MKTGRGSMWWLGLACACGTLAFMGSAEAGKPRSSPPEYVVVDWAAPESLAGSHLGKDINNAGHVVGLIWQTNTAPARYDPFLLDPLDADGDGRPDTWFVDEVGADGAPGPDGQNDLITRLGHFGIDRGPAGLSGQATSVNDLGLVVGTSEYLPFIVVPREDSWYEDSDGDGINDLMLHLGSLPGGQDANYGGLIINNPGQVIGYGGGRGFLLTPEVDALGVVHWFRDGGSGVNALMVDLGTFIPVSINDRGEIVGRIGDNAVLRRPDGSMIELGGYAGPGGMGAINNHGQIGLLVYHAPSGYLHAGLITPEDTDADGEPDRWYRDADADGTNDLIVDLGTLEGMVRSDLVGLNNIGSVVGKSSEDYDPLHPSQKPRRAGWYLWRGGVMRGLNDLTGGQSWRGAVMGINDADKILCENGSLLIPASR